MENDLFRKSSLERISSPEQLNEYIKITNPGIWCTLAGLLALMAAVGFWSFLGTVSDTVSAKGMIFPQNGVIAVNPLSGGRITDIRVKVGDFVQAGQIIAIIPQEEILQQIQELKHDQNADQKNVKSLISSYESHSIIVSPVSGIVLEARRENEMVSSSDAVAKIVKQEKYADDKQVICYIPTSEAKKLSTGMGVQVSPDFAPREEYGFMYGHITSIGKYPVTQADVLSAIGSTQYAEGLLPPGNCVEVKITLVIDPDADNKIKWSNKKGESIPLSIGTNCNLLIVVNERRPYELVFQ
ncbi:biotin/lipoyl-binding protein [Petroclostridium sp. X23]|uniref:biotin/lipoyl-binding protein n=1 Tax=Petroclostridium sp. X23 TaxID=3045146 RepID=UPI0024ACFE08|nr:biotin/lipoyl-binding protein [Petroclostridium sp. X23]WHH58780.1 HlyD family efflux transporter periplasmic adaptor subunit [Petroclostridium sp. X23]